MLMMSAYCMPFLMHDSNNHSSNTPGTNFRCSFRASAALCHPF